MTVTAPAGTAAGAVYKPLLLIVPTVALPLVRLLTCQVTAVLALPVTVAVNCWVCPVGTLVKVGETLTATVCGAPVTVTVAVVERSLLISHTARIVTGAAGAAAGALYNPLDVIVPLLLPPFTYQYTFVLVVPVTVAVN